ncbi:MAG: HD domain-containing protein [Bacillota bacterium]
MTDLKTNSLLAQGLEMATIAHQGQLRKGKEKPYVVHPIEVAMTLLEAGLEDEVIVAGLLHDTLEDTRVTPEDLQIKFNGRVLDLVRGASEELADRENTDWEQRKQHTIDYLKTAQREIQYIACADKLSNIRSMIRDYERIGDQLWSIFSRGYEQQSWYYNNLAASLEDLEGEEMYEQFKLAVEYMFND